MGPIDNMAVLKHDFLIYAFCILLALTLVVQWALRPKPNAPLLNPRRFFEVSNFRAMSEVLFKTRQVLEEWFAEHPARSMRLICDLGEITFLPPSMADKLKNDPRLSFIKASNDSAFHINIPGFEPFREGGRNEAAIIKAVVHKNLNKELNEATSPLAEETSLAIAEYFGNDQDWHKVPLRDTLLPLVTRISTRIFLGKDLCRNEEWLRIAESYSAISAMAANHLRKWPRPLRYFVSLFSSDCRDLKKQVKDARALINPILAKRRQLKQEASAQGKNLEYNDSLEWFEQHARESYDPAAMQLFLSVVSVHTTTDLLCQALTDICYHPEIIGPLKSEIRTIIQQEGWRTAALYKMKLLDSVIKESQRLKPVQIASMLRLSLDNMTLEDGTFIPKGHLLSVSCHAMRDDDIYKNASSWDGYRFYREREKPGKQNTAQLVTTSPEHLGFGYGVHACPGRFFAANEVKIVMIYLLLQYEWRVLPGSKPNPVSWGTTWSTDPAFELEMRRNALKDLDLEAMHM